MSSSSEKILHKFIKNHCDYWACLIYISKITVPNTEPVYVFFDLQYFERVIIS